MSALKFVRAKVADSILEPLVEKAADHDVSAWHDLVLLLWPGVLEIAGRWRSMRNLSADEDARLDVAAAVVERLARNGFEGLQRLQVVLETGRASGRDAAWPWVCRVTEYKSRDYRRHNLPLLDRDPEEGTAIVARFVPLSDDAEELLPDSVRTVDLVTAHEVMDHARSVLSPPQMSALELRLLGDEDETIATTLSLPGPRDAYRLWHGAVNRLHYRFVVKGGGRCPGEKK